MFDQYRSRFACFVGSSGVLGGGVGSRCNVSVYTAGSSKEYIDFVNDPPEPATGNISTIGYRDPATGEFNGVLKSVYWDGVSALTDTVVDYVQDSDSNYHPETDALYIDDNTLLTMVNADEMDYGKGTYPTNPGFIEGWEIKPDNTGAIGILYRATHSTLAGSIDFRVQASGITTWQINDNTGALIGLTNGTIDIVTDGLYHKCWLEAEENSGDPTKYDFIQYVDGVEAGRNNAIDISGGLKFNQFSWAGIAGFRFKGYIRRIFSSRKGPGLFLRAPLLGYYDLTGRLRDDLADSKRFDMQDLDLEYPNTLRYLQISSTAGVFPQNVDGYVKKEETYNA